MNDNTSNAKLAFLAIPVGSIIKCSYNHISLHDASLSQSMNSRRVNVDTVCIILKSYHIADYSTHTRYDYDCITDDGRLVKLTLNRKDLID